MKNNPLMQIPFENNGVPPFDKIKAEHFLPALNEAMKIGKAEIEEIKKIPNPNFENVIEAMEKSGELLNYVSSVFYHYDSAVNNDEIQKIALEFKTNLTKHYSDISLDSLLFKQIKAVYDKKNEYNLREEEEILLDDSYKSFVRNGALLNDNDKEILRKIDENLAELTNKFGENLLAETNKFKLFINDESELTGLPEGAKTQAKEAADEEENAEGKYLFTLHAPSVVPVLTYAENRSLREKIWRAFSTRCKSGEFDNKPVLLEIVRLRDKRAKLLGYKNHAEYVLEERMAKNSANVISMIENYKNIVRKPAEKELAELKEFAKLKYNADEIKPWDIGFYAEKLKAEKYGFNGEMLRPYFQFEKVRNGAFEVASKLYNLEISQAKNYPIYNDDVEVFEVKDAETKDLIGIIYTDYFPRKTKRGGAWMDNYITQGRLENGKRKPPVIGNHGNFTKPTKDKPSLLTMEEVLTLFHEFGHGLHGLLSNTKYKSQAGTSVKWDFVELPSQIMENWVKEKEVLDLFARHYESGELIPVDLVQKMKDADNFRAASAFLRQMQLSQLDMAWHMVSPENISDVEKFEYETCKDFYLLNPEGSLNSTNFSHIFDGGYSAGYYSYKWAEILDADAFEAFKENGLFNKEIAKKFRQLLASGGSKDPEKLYILFRGKKPDPNALLRREGLV
ncbi:MAG: M3 family metallopeptidase [Rickettsiales bacterium]|nr:M3 family metallopeptidase [Rickettsiales bacterium]